MPVFGQGDGYVMSLSLPLLTNGLLGNLDFLYVVSHRVSPAWLTWIAGFFHGSSELQGFISERKRKPGRNFPESSLESHVAFYSSEFYKIDYELIIPMLLNTI